MIPPATAGDLYAFMRGGDGVPALEGHLLPGGLRIDALLGRGGMGAVYRASDTYGNPFAVKVLLPEAAADPRARERARREAEILRRLEGPGIPRVVAEGEWEGTPYFVTAWVEGATLAAVLENESPLPAERAVRIARGILEILRRAHRRGVLHRDLKPQNILLGALDQPTLVDFGISKLDGPPGRGDADVHTRAGQGLGTPRYAAPEQLDDAASASVRGDVYSVGAILYEMLTGRPFGEWRGADQPARQRAALELAGAPPHVARAVRKAVRPSPHRRFGGAGAFALALAGPWTPPALALAAAESALPLAATLAGLVAAALALRLDVERTERAELGAAVRLREVERDAARAQVKNLENQIEAIKKVVAPPAADPSLVRKEAEEIWQDLRALLGRGPDDGRPPLRRLLERCQDFCRVEREPRYQPLVRLRDALEWRSRPHRVTLTVTARGLTGPGASTHKVRVAVEHAGKTRTWESARTEWLELAPGAKTADRVTLEWNAFDPLALRVQEEGWLYGWNDLVALSPASASPPVAAGPTPFTRIDTWTALRLPTDTRENPYVTLEVRPVETAPPPDWPPIPP